MRREDWEDVKLPDLATLIELCDLLEIRADYLLFGDGSPYRGQFRDEATLASDLETHVTRELGAEAERLGLVAHTVDGADILHSLTESARNNIPGRTSWTITSRMGFVRQRSLRAAIISGMA
jgi:hypothetical protein